MASPDELIEAFASAVPFALREMAGVEAAVREARPAGSADGSADLSAVVCLTTAAGQGRFTLSLPAATATGLARRVLAGTTDDVSTDLVRDCAGELANVVAGQAKALLVGSPCHFMLSTPAVRAGGPADPAAGWVIRFESDAGPFAVHLSALC